MEDFYSQALACYQKNDFESALNLTRLCDSSSQANALQQECMRSLKKQYEYLFKDTDTKQVDEYIRKYILLLGRDEYIERIILKKIAC